MLEYLQNRTEASYLVTEVVTRIAEEESDAVAKLGYIRRVVAYAKDSVAIEDSQQLRLLMLSPETAKYFTDATFTVHDGTYRLAAAKNTDTHLAGVMSYVSASGLVFAHSFMEFVLETLLRMTRLCDIGSWLLFLRTKTVQVSTILDSELEVALEAKLNEFITSLHKEGITTKIEHLAKLLKCSLTKSSVINYTYDPDRLKAIDRLRHDLAHHRKKDYSIDIAEEDIVYLYRTTFHFLTLVVHRYDLHGAYRPSVRSGT